MKFRTVFFGTPEYALPIFEYLAEKESLAAAVTRSDKASGRHCRVTPSPVKTAALRKSIPVFTPENLCAPEFISGLAALNPQIAVVVAYGRILPPAVIKIFPKNCINLHFSVLPKYRGAAPIQWAIINGEKSTGVTSFFIDDGLDTGKIIESAGAEIKMSDDLEQLRTRLVELSVGVLERSLQKIRHGFAGFEQQGETCYAPPLKKSDGKINWADSAEKIYNLVRGTKPWPCAYTEITGAAGKKEFLKILESETVEDSGPAPAFATPGTVVEILKNKGFLIRCGAGRLLIKTVQPASKKPMSAWAFLQGRRLCPGMRL